MMPTFKSMSIEEFDKHFATKDACLAYLSDQKWLNGFTCKKCGHTNSCAGQQPYSKRCTKCKTQESATANTAFHACKISLTEAFKLAFLVCQQPNISSYEISRMMEIRQMTCWKFKKKITDCIDGKGNLNVFQKIVL